MYYAIKFFNDTLSCDRVEKIRRKFLEIFSEMFINLKSKFTRRENLGSLEKAYFKNRNLEDLAHKNKHT